MAKNYALIKCREELNVTQEELARKISMDKTSYVYKETGKRKIWVHEANNILKALNKIASSKQINKVYKYDDIFFE